MNIPESCCENFQKSSLSSLKKRGLPGGRFSCFRGDPKAHKKLLRMVVLQALALGLIFAPRAAVAARHPAAHKHPPVMIFQDNQGVGPAIVPNDGGTSIEYRKVLFRERSRAVMRVYAFAPHFSPNFRS